MYYFKMVISSFSLVFFKSGDFSFFGGGSGFGASVRKVGGRPLPEFLYEGSVKESLFYPILFRPLVLLGANISSSVMLRSLSKVLFLRFFFIYCLLSICFKLSGGGFGLGSFEKASSR